MASPFRVFVPRLITRLKTYVVLVSIRDVLALVHGDESGGVGNLTREE